MKNRSSNSSMTMTSIGSQRSIKIQLACNWKKDTKIYLKLMILWATSIAILSSAILFFSNLIIKATCASKPRILCISFCPACLFQSKSSSPQRSKLVKMRTRFCRTYNLQITSLSPMLMNLSVKIVEWAEQEISNSVLTTNPVICSLPWKYRVVPILEKTLLVRFDHPKRYKLKRKHTVV